MKKFLAIAAASLLTLSSLGTANAALIGYSSRATFNTAAISFGPTVTEDFEDNLGLGSSLAFTNVTATRSTGFNLANDDGTLGGFSPVTSGSFSLNALLNSSGEKLILTLPLATNSFGAEITTASNVTLTFTTSNGDTISNAFAAGVTEFFGFTGPSVFTITEVSTSATGWVGLDELTLNAVPEPGSCAVFASLVAGVLIRRRKS